MKRLGIRRLLNVMTYHSGGRGPRLTQICRAREPKVTQKEEREGEKERGRERVFVHFTKHL